MLALLMSLMVQASPVPVVIGNYQVSDQFEVLTHVRDEMVYTEIETGRVRVVELQSQGYTCVVINSQFTKCTGILHDQGDTVALKAIVQKKLQGLIFTFEPNAADPSLVNDAEAIKEYSVPQKVTLWEKPFQTVKAQWNPITYLYNFSAWKFQLGSSRDEYYFPFLVESGKPVLTLFVSIQSHWVSDNYTLSLHLENLP